MSAVILTANGRRWRFSPVDPPPDAGRLRTVAFARILDDLTLAPPRGPLTARSDTPPLAGRVGPDGLVGLIGTPARHLPSAQVAGTPVAVTVTALGYDDLPLAGTLGPQPGYPAAFQPLDLGVRRLRRRAVTIRGRVLRLVGTALQPVSGATVKVTAAVPVRALAGATPAPPAAAVFTALSVTTDAQGDYRLPAFARALSVTITASSGAASTARTVSPDYADPDMIVDFRLP